MSREANGADIVALRRDKGWSQRELARQAYIHHSTVQYWEKQSALDWDSFVVQSIAVALDWDANVSSTRARHGVMSYSAMDAIMKEQAHLLSDRLAKRLWNARVTCGAKTRKGTPCRAKSMPGKRRCKLHGGMSTGPRGFKQSE